MPIKLKRILAGLIDFWISCFISTILVAIVTLGKLDISILSMSTYFLSFVLCYILKDMLFGNASIGKIFMKIKIVLENKNNLDFITAVKRALPIIFLPIEVFLILVVNKRIGDMLAKTSVVNYIDNKLKKFSCEEI